MVDFVSCDESTFLLRRCRLSSQRWNQQRCSSAASAAATLEHKRFNDESKKKMPRDRVVKFTMVSTKHSAPGSEETGGFFRCFCLLLSLLTKVGRAGARNTPIPQHKKALCYGG
jgi:hypothetical protein